MTAWSSFTTWLANVPVGVWVAAIVGNIVLTGTTWSLARRRVRQAGQRLVDPAAPTPARAKDTALTIASLVPASLFWLMVLGGSLHGLVAFGRTTLGWQGGWEYLVPGTLDGVSVTFAVLAFRAVRRGKVPDRCYRVVRGAAFASATINFAHEYELSRNALAGGYLALLSLFGMFIFDELLQQFEDGTARIRRENPKFGLRWLTWPTNTLLAAIAWRNHPPPEGTPGTVANAVANLHRVRHAKQAARHGVPAAGGPSTTMPHSRRRESVPPPANRSIEASEQGSAARIGHHGSRGAVKVPTAPATVARWAAAWVAMCQRPDLAWAAMQDDPAARDHFGLSPRQLRNVRYAATTGALRQRARDLGVSLPGEYDDASAT